VGGFRFVGGLGQHLGGRLRQQVPHQPDALDVVAMVGHDPLEFGEGVAQRRDFRLLDDCGQG
jgi:hypothetical protein